MSMDRNSAKVHRQGNLTPPDSITDRFSLFSSADNNNLVVKWLRLELESPLVWQRVML
jgi:hypothetical protein